MRLVCISDTHLRHNLTLPDGDILIHAGDLTQRGTLDEIKCAMDWLESLPFKHKCVIAGNHDWGFQVDSIRARALVPPGVTYLEDSYTIIDGLKIWGSPWQPYFCNWAFNLYRGEDLKRKWDLIPLDTDVLITHGPPRTILDMTAGVWGPSERVGCEDLLARVQQVHPMLHVFGHIHCSYGVHKEDGIIYVNASSCDESYFPSNYPVVVDL